MRTDVMSRARVRARGARVWAANTSNGDGHLAAARSCKASKVTTARSGVDTLATQPALVTLICTRTGNDDLTYLATANDKEVSSMQTE